MSKSTRMCTEPMYRYRLAKTSHLPMICVLQKGDGMNAKELVRRWKDRQTQILAMLPEAIRTEFHELTVAIRRAESEFAESKRASSAENGRPAIIGAGGTGEDFGQILEKMSQRVPLESRKKQVAEFLAKNGPAMRSEILRAVEIPNGSLTNVLLDKELFEQNESGSWQLVKKASGEKPKGPPNAPPKPPAPPPPPG